MPKYKYEIEYQFQPDKDQPARVHWMYVEVEAKTIASSKTKAVEHYNRQTRECGWTRYCTLNEIRPLSKPKDPPKHKVVAEEPKPKPKTRRRTTPKKPAPKKPTTRTKKK